MSERHVFNAAIFRRGGQKRELFDDKEQDDWDESTELREKLGDLHVLWSTPRTGRDLAAAIWRADLGVAEVVLFKGKLINHMGYTKGSKNYLHIEEAVYLVDRTNLLLFLEPGGAQEEQRLLSLQEAYNLMVGCGISMEQYLVYCKLMRAGYIVQRHPARWILRPTEDPRQVWHRWYPHAQQPEQAAALRTGPQQPAQPAATGNSQQQQQQAAGSGSSQPAAAKAAAGVSRVPAAPAGCASGGAPGKKKIKLEQVQHGSWWAAGATSLPWLQGLPADFLDGLPRCEVVPDSRSRWAAEFPAMSPLPTLPDAELAQQGEPDADFCLLDFDVYDPNSRFSRKGAGPPSFSVAVLPPPSCAAGANHLFLALGDMAAADRASPGIPVKFATVEEGDIAFYGMAQVELRSILPG